MCLGVPGKVIATADNEWGMSKVEIGGIERDVSLQLVPDAGVGDWVLIHAGFAIQKIDEREAEETMKLLNAISDGHALDLIDLNELPDPGGPEQPGTDVA